jgi:hypothetical protein
MIILAVFNVRNMNDSLMIRKEMTWVVGAWIGFDFFQYLFFEMS